MYFPEEVWLQISLNFKPGVLLRVSKKFSFYMVNIGTNRI
jgi:hypothetical protein